MIEKFLTISVLFFLYLPSAFAENEIGLSQAIAIMLYAENHCGNLDVQQEKMENVYARNGFASEEEIPDRYQAPVKAIIGQMEEKNTLLECDNLYRAFGSGGSVESGFLKLKGF